MKTLAEWVSYIGTLHPTTVAPGLERVAKVAEKLNLSHPTPCVITVAGTNGKGSCVAALEAIYMAQGYKVGAFTSPYLIRLNEEVRINNVEASDEAFCQAFERIEAARGDITLTIFEFNTLAALEIFSSAKLDVILLEVGLGGRLDAVNIIDADLAIISSIALDHTDLLGNTRELIAREKAGILRQDRPAVCGDYSVPITLLEQASKLNVTLYCQEIDFNFICHEDHWEWQSNATHYEDLSMPSLALQNMSTVLMVVEILQSKLPVSLSAIQNAIANVQLPGRIQIFPGAVTRIFDVSHNPAAAAFLAEKLAKIPCEGKTHAVFSMLADKDIVGTVRVMKPLIDAWYIAALHVQRGTPLAILQESFLKAKITAQVKPHIDIAQAYQSAIDDAETGDRVIVFGSFHTVADVIMHVI